MQFKKTVLASLLIASGIISTPTTALANDSDELEQLRALVQELDQKVRVLDRKNELAEETATTKKKETPVIKASPNGFGLESADGQNSIRLRGLLQTDYRSFEKGKSGVGAISVAAPPGFYPANDANDSFLARRVRPTVEGTLGGIYDFRFTPEFGDNKSEVVDAYIDARFKPEFQVRVGKFKPYVGLERLQSAADTKLIERSYVTNAILPNRDIGVALHGDVLDNKLNYAFGIMNGVTDGGDSTTTTTTIDDREYQARLFSTPFKDSDSALAGLGFGTAVTYSDVDSTFNSSTGALTNSDLTTGYKTEAQQTFFQYSAASYLDGRHLKIAPQAYYYYGPFGLMTEYVREENEVNYNVPVANKPNGVNNTTLTNNAWEITASYLLTGEDASFKGVKPKQNFDLNAGGWGAWELVARYDEINLDDDTFKNFGTGGTLNSTRQRYFGDLRNSAKSAKTWVGGINWYLNPNYRVALNYEQTSFDGGDGDGNPNAAVAKGATPGNVKDREDERAIFARFQVSY
jgi:phosphate-selective porin OprO and OprP